MMLLIFFFCYSLSILSLLFVYIFYHELDNHSVPKKKCCRSGTEFICTKKSIRTPSFHTQNKKKKTKLCLRLKKKNQEHNDNDKTHINKKAMFFLLFFCFFVQTLAKYLRMKKKTNI